MPDCSHKSERIVLMMRVQKFNNKVVDAIQQCYASIIARISGAILFVGQQGDALLPKIWCLGLPPTKLEEGI